MSAAVGDQILVNADPLLAGGALTAPGVVCRVVPADPEDEDSVETVSAWVFPDYAVAPQLRQGLSAAPGGVLPEPKKKDGGVRDLTVWAPVQAPAAPAPAPAAAPDPGAGAGAGGSAA